MVAHTQNYFIKVQKITASRCAHTHNYFIEMEKNHGIWLRTLIEIEL
jgi:hypothetical protein